MIENKHQYSFKEYEKELSKKLTEILYDFYSNKNNQSFSTNDSPLTYKIKSNKSKKQAKHIIEKTYEDIIDFIIPGYDKNTQLLSQEQAQTAIFCMTNVFIEADYEAKKKKDISERLPVLSRFLDREKKEYTQRIKERAKLSGQ